MNNFKRILLSLTVLISMTIIGMVRTPQPSKVAGNSAEVEQLRKKIANLPPDIRQEILNTYFFATYPSSIEIANRIRSMQDCWSNLEMSP